MTLYGYMIHHKRITSQGDYTGYIMKDDDYVWESAPHHAIHRITPLDDKCLSEGKKAEKENFRTFMIHCLLTNRLQIRTMLEKPLQGETHWLKIVLLITITSFRKC